MVHGLTALWPTGNGQMGMELRQRNMGTLAGDGDRRARKAKAHYGAAGAAHQLPSVDTGVPTLKSQAGDGCRSCLHKLVVRPSLRFVCWMRSSFLPSTFPALLLSRLQAFCSLCQQTQGSAVLSTLWAFNQIPTIAKLKACSFACALLCGYWMPDFA